MKNNILSKIRKNFTKKDAVYLIVISLMSGLVIGSFIGGGPRSRGHEDFGFRDKVFFKEGKSRGHHDEFFWQNDMMPKATPSPKTSISPTPSITPKSPTT